HTEQIAKAVKPPIMAYNIPQFSEFDITPEIFTRLRQIDTVRYIKDSTANMLRIEQLAASGANVFNGCDYLNLYGLIAGAVGCFSGGGNAMPRESVELYEHVQAGRRRGAAARAPRARAAHTPVPVAPRSPPGPT